MPVGTKFSNEKITFGTPPTFKQRHLYPAKRLYFWTFKRNERLFQKSIPLNGANDARNLNH